MTDQYGQPNINGDLPRGARFVDEDGDLTTDDDLIVVDSSSGPVSINLYSAEGLPGNRLFIKALNAGVNPVTIAAQPGQTIDGAADQILTADLEGIILKSDGENWVIMGTFGAPSAGGGLVPACIPGPGSSGGLGPGPGFPASNLLTGTGGGGLASFVGFGGPAPYSLDVFVDVETSTLEPGAVPIVRTPYPLSGATISVDAVASAVNPNDPLLTRFTISISGATPFSGQTALFAFGVVNPSGGVGFAGYASISTLLA